VCRRRLEACDFFHHHRRGGFLPARRFCGLRGGRLRGCRFRGGGLRHCRLLACCFFLCCCHRQFLLIRSQNSDQLLSSWSSAFVATAAEVFARIGEFGARRSMKGLFGAALVRRSARFSSGLRGTTGFTASWRTCCTPVLKKSSRLSSASAC